MDYDEKVDRVMDSYIDHLAKLIAIPTHRDEASTTTQAPFGEGIQQAFDYVSKLAEGMGFIVHKEDGYAIDIRTREGEDYIGILCHIDTVEAIEKEKWKSDPYTLVEKDGVLYGRGVNDNKGPLLALLYVLKILKEQKQVGKPIRLIIGGAEETTWECMDHYFSNNPQPLWAFSPDGDFPIVNGEKGILKVRVTFEGEETTYDVIHSLESPKKEGFICNEAVLTLKTGQKIPLKGKHAVSRHPERGLSAAVPLLEEVEKRKWISRLAEEDPFYRLTRFLKEGVVTSEKDVFALKKEDPDMGTSSVAVMALHYMNGRAAVELDFRYTRTHTRESLLDKIQEAAQQHHGKVYVLHEKPLLYVEKDTPLIQKLQRAYEEVTGEKAEPITKGGASYARVLKRGVAFGPTFPGEIPNSHLENEKLSLASIKKAMKIYLIALDGLLSEY